MKREDRASSGGARALQIVKLAVAIGLIWWLLASDQLDFREALNLKDRWHWVFLAIACCGLVQAITVWRWRILLRVQGIQYGYGEVFRLCLIGLFFNQCVPGSTGGDLYRVWAVARDNPGFRSAGVVSVVVDRGTGLLMTLALVPLALIFTWDVVAADPILTSLVVTVAVTLLAGTVFTLLLVSLRFRRLRLVRAILGRLPMQEGLKTVDRAIRVHLEHPWLMVLLLLVGLLVQVLVVLTGVCLAFALIPDLEAVAVLFLTIPLALTVMALPINPPGAIGTGEATYQYLLSIVGVPNGSLLSLLQRAVLILWAIPGAILYVSSRSKSAVAEMPPSEDLQAPR